MRTKVSENGVLIPKDLLTGITEVDIRKKNGVIIVSPAGKNDSMDDIGKEPVAYGTPDASEDLEEHLAQTTEAAAKQPWFGSARGLVNVSDDFDEPLRADDPIFNIGRNPVALGISDASENLDEYLYGDE
jgi:hypothetical protein